MPENLYTTDCIRTFTGKYVNVFEPDPETICIEDIAHALSMQCRFGGHLPVFFSVAQHSVMVCNEFDEFKPELRLTALMHDATEAYLLDIPRPIKLRLANYKALENSLMVVIANKFGFKWPTDQVIKKVDAFQLQREWDQLMLGKAGEIRCMSQRESKIQFLKAFEYIKEFYPSNV